MATTTVYVRPIAPLVPETIKLSPIDQYMARLYIPLLLFFKINADASRRAICSDLQLGLGNLLNEMPFLAGNVIIEDDERGTVQMDIPENPGVLFKIKDLTDPEKGPTLDYDELEKAWFPPSSLDPAALTPIHFVPEPIAPCFAVQANFIRGGLILALFCHHTVMDGVAMATVWKRLSSHVAAISESRVLPDSELFQAKALERSSLFGGSGSRRLTDFPGFEKRRAQAAPEPESSGPSVSLETKADKQTSQSPPLTIAYWYISRENLRELEKKGKSTKPTDIKLTEGNIFSAFVWRHYGRARCLQQHGIKTMSFFMPCDARARLDPPLHPDYPGNAVVYSKADVPIDELFSSKPDALYRIASHIHSSIEWWSSDKIWDLLSAMDSWPRVGDVVRSVDVSCKTVLTITNTSPFPLFASYWGVNMGTPCTLRMPGTYVKDGRVVILPRLPDGGMEFITCLDVESLEHLKADGEFTRYAQFRCR
ncbi:transferase family-domain-containing protein [Leptodontidium sp. 2 PMI_412]|nr:transferase family-domain-containing protein [Leptodontidium sp. 2 PMI_412]